MSILTLMLATAVNFTVQTATHPDDFKTFDTERIRSRFVMEKVMAKLKEIAPDVRPDYLPLESLIAPEKKKKK